MVSRELLTRQVDFKTAREPVPVMNPVNFVSTNNVSDE
ncbi:hypothetical protein IWX64_003446 [Arthrobacter sp. CAN_A212]